MKMQMSRHLGMATLMLALAAVGTRAQEAPSAPFRSFTTFDGRVKITPAAGPAALADRAPGEIPVTYKTFMIGAHTAMVSLPAGPDENLVIELASGIVTTVIGDQTLSRNAGDFWAVPAGQNMAVTTDDRAAVLRVLSLPAR